MTVFDYVSPSLSLSTCQESRIGNLWVNALILNRFNRSYLRFGGFFEWHLYPHGIKLNVYQGI